MSRFLFFLLLLAATGLGLHLWLTAATDKADYSTRERNRDEVRIVAVTPPALAAKNSEDTQRAQQALAGAACVEFSGIAAADAPRARTAFDALALGDRLSERRVEEISRYWVFIPAVTDRKAADSAVAQLKRQGVSDVSLRPDNSISLGRVLDGGRGRALPRVAAGQGREECRGRPLRSRASRNRDDRSRA